jgi:hypothetical protein
MAGAGLAFNPGRIPSKLAKLFAAKLAAGRAHDTPYPRPTARAACMTRLTGALTDTRATATPDPACYSPHGDL